MLDERGCNLGRLSFESAVGFANRFAAQHAGFVQAQRLNNKPIMHMPPGQVHPCHSYTVYSYTDPQAPSSIIHPHFACLYNSIHRAHRAETNLIIASTAPTPSTQPNSHPKTGPHTVACTAPRICPMRPSSRRRWGCIFGSMCR
jgi:hypothetical protein